jgi:hypothetical protein
MRHILANGNVINQTTFDLLPDSFKIGSKIFEEPKKPEVLTEPIQRGRKAKA